MAVEPEKTTSPEKVGRLSHQFGKFGEGLVLWWLGQFHNYSVALVDHEGADIVAHKGDEHLAISVKSYHARARYFDQQSQKNLRTFAERFGTLTPAVAFVFVDHDNERENNAMVDVFLIKLDDFDFFGFPKHKDKPQDYLISNGANFGTLEKLVGKYPEKKILHLRMQQTAEWAKK
jgi:Holliday junction resolvase